MQFTYNDGGRALEGYKGSAGDCCVRAFAIATGTPYAIVYKMVNDIALRERNKVGRRMLKSSARLGVYVATAHKLAYELNFRVR